MESQTNKLIEKEIRFVVTRGGGGVGGSWRKVVKRYKLPVTRQVSIRDVMCNIVTVVNTTV